MTPFDQSTADPTPTACKDFVRTLVRSLRRTSIDTTPDAGDLDHEDDWSHVGHTLETRREVDPVVVGAAVLLATRLAPLPLLLDRYEREATVAILEVQEAEWMEPIAKALAACFDLSGAKPYRRPNGSQAVPSHVGSSKEPVVVVAPRDRASRSNFRDGKVARAFQEHRSLVGIATSHESNLPADLVAASQERFVLGGLDAAGIGMVVEHVVGTAPRCSVPGDVAAALRPSDLGIAVHPARGADGSIDRLTELVSKRLKTTFPKEGPKLESLAGYGAAREWGLSTAADLAAYARGDLTWSACEPGVLLAGPPGTGKTMFAAAMARQAGVPMMAGSLAQWQAAGEAHLGSTLAAMRGFFNAARRAAPCVALIDELDSFGDRRLFDARHRQYSTQIVNGLLECLDGDGGRDGVLIVGTTNDPERIDAAIVRSGRFDRCISIPLPSISDIASILRHHLGEDLADVDLGDIARRAVGCTGADCAAWVRRARGRARRSKRALRSADLSSEMNPLEEGSGRSDDLRAAVHEGGHAIVAHALGFQVRSVAINRITSTGGATWLQDLGPYPTAGTLHDLLVVHLAGRAAEVLVLGCPSIGSATDLAAATEICSRMHCSWGLAGSILVRRHDVLSDELAASVQRDLDRAYAAARTIVEQHRVGLDLLIRELVERRALDQAELASLIGHMIQFGRSHDMHVSDR